MSDLFAGGSYRWQAEAEELRELIYAGRMPVIKENVENITVSDAVKEVFAIPAGAYGSLCLSGSVSADGTLLSVLLDEGEESRSFCFSLPAGEQTVSIPFYCAAAQSGSFRVSASGGTVTVPKGKIKCYYTRP